MIPVPPTGRDLPVLSPAPQGLPRHANGATYVGGGKVGNSFEHKAHASGWSYVQVATCNRCREPSAFGATYSATSCFVKTCAPRVATGRPLVPGVCFVSRSTTMRRRRSHRAEHRVVLAYGRLSASLRFHKAECLRWLAIACSRRGRGLGRGQTEAPQGPLASGYRCRWWVHVVVAGYPRRRRCCGLQPHCAPRPARGCACEDHRAGER
jgi:hypothetical protein